MTEFVEMLVKAKSGDPQATEELLNMYRPLLCKEALVGGIFDEDLFQELCLVFLTCVATVYKGNIIKNLIMDCQSYTKYRPNETTGGIFVSWRRKEELPTGA